MAFTRVIALPSMIRFGFPSSTTVPPFDSSISALNLAPLHPDISLSRRSKMNPIYRPKTRVNMILASKSKPPGETEKSDAATTKGPPFLTILAGVTAFLVIGWISWSILLWLVSLVAMLFSST